MSDPANFHKPSLELVLSLLRARLSVLPKPPKDSLRGAFKEALALAASHQVAAALSNGLRRTALDGSGWSDLVPFLQLIEAENIHRNSIFGDAAIRTAALLDEKGISSVFLKGAAVVLESENYAPWRQVTDLDILIAPDNLYKAASTLLAHGYHAQSDHGGFKEGIHHHYPALYDNRSGTFVELHVRLMQDEKENLLKTADILEQAIPIKRDGQSLLIPCPEHRMIHLIAHAQISNWGYVLRQITLKDVLDAVELDACHKIDWGIVRKAFVNIQAEDQLLGFIWAAHHLTALRLPFPEGQFGDGKAWADAAISALYAPQEGWRTSLRVIAHYTRLYARDPVRLKMVWKTLSDPARLKHLWNVNCARLKLPE